MGVYGEINASINQKLLKLFCRNCDIGDLFFIKTLKICLLKYRLTIRIAKKSNQLSKATVITFLGGVCMNKRKYLEISKVDINGILGNLLMARQSGPPVRRPCQSLT